MPCLRLSHLPYELSHNSHQPRAEVQRKDEPAANVRDVLELAAVEVLRGYGIGQEAVLEEFLDYWNENERRDRDL